MRLALVAFLLLAALTPREERDLIAKLPERHRQFLIDVEPILTPSERGAFLELETDAQRDVFIENFWRRRDRERGLTNFAVRDEYAIWLDYVKTNFESVASDRGRIYLLYGPPSEIIDTECQPYQPMQIWKYPRIESLGSGVRLLFYLHKHRREYKLWLPVRGGRGSVPLDELMRDQAALGRSKFHCHFDEVKKAIGAMSIYQEKVHTLTIPPPINEEDLKRMMRFAVISDENAPKLDGAELKVAYLPGDGRNTGTQLTINVPRAALKTTSAGESSVYTLDVVGEVLRDEKMWEKYRYRFDFPGDIGDATLPLVIDRFLRPGAYRSRVKITDPATGAQTVLEQDLEVPSRSAVAQPPLSRSESGDLVAALLSTRARLRIVPFEDGVLSGVQTIQTLITGTGIHAVEFWLDGKRVATRRAPPYTLDLDFGSVPRTRRIRVVALDSHGEVITGDEMVVNTGTDPFRVHIVSPRIAPKLSGPTRVEIDVRVPEGRQLASLDLYYNDRRVARMFDPPFLQTVNIRPTDGVGYLRAVATAGGESVEDVVMVNTPNQMAEIDVHLVELPTTVLRDGKPVDHLTETSFKVFDQGQPVKLAKFEHVRDLPLSIGIAVDTSGSMEAKMADAREAGAAFFTNVLKKGDKAFVVGFDTTPHTVQKWTSDLGRIHTGLAKLRPEESTALYDAIVYSLYNFLGVKGQKALIVLTDGKDTASKFSFDQALEYAQRAAVPIYAIGIGIPLTDRESRTKLNRLCTETGGNAYYIDSAKDLTGIYADVQNELRSQYLLGFYPTAKGSGWREVTVQVADAKVKTIRGYYP